MDCHFTFIVIIIYRVIYIFIDNFIEIVSCVPTWNIGTYSYSVNVTWRIQFGSPRYDNISEFFVDFYSDFYSGYRWKEVSDIPKNVYKFYY